MKRVKVLIVKVVCLFHVNSLTTTGPRTESASRTLVILEAPNMH